MKQAPFEWGAAGTALEDVSGDVDVVATFDGGAVVALIDGLGHGEHAAAAAEAAAKVLAAHAQEDVVALIRLCHEALRHTRGAAMSVVSFSAATSSLSWAGVGNVDGVLLRVDGTRDAIVTRGGVVGFQLPPLRASTASLSPGDTVILATDGIRTGFHESARVLGPPLEIAEAILARHAKGTDDARVVVARWTGGAS